MSKLSGRAGMMIVVDCRVNHRWALSALADRVAGEAVVVVAVLPGCIEAAFATRLVVPSLDANKVLKRAEPRAGAAIVMHFDQGRALAARLASVPDPLVRIGSTARRRRRGRRRANEEADSVLGS